MRFFALLFIVFLFPLPVRAQEHVAPEPTRIEVDSEAGEIHFYIEGVLEAVLKNDGLHVRDDVLFGGTIFDSGQDFHFSNSNDGKDEDAP